MSKSTKENLIAFVFGCLVAFLIAWVVVRDIDKDVKRECGMKRFDNAPEYCVQWWDANEVE